MWYKSKRKKANIFVFFPSKGQSKVLLGTKKYASLPLKIILKEKKAKRLLKVSLVNKKSKI